MTNFDIFLSKISPEVTYSFIIFQFDRIAFLEANCFSGIFVANAKALEQIYLLQTLTLPLSLDSPKCHNGPNSYLMLTLHFNAVITNSPM